MDECYPSISGSSRFKVQPKVQRMHNKTEIESPLPFNINFGLKKLISIYNRRGIKPYGNLRHGHGHRQVRAFEI